MRLTRQSEVAISILAACARSPMRKITTMQAADRMACVLKGLVSKAIDDSNNSPCLVGSAALEKVRSV